MSAKKKGLPKEEIKSDLEKAVEVNQASEAIEKPEVQAETEFTAEEENEIIEATDNKDFEVEEAQATGQDLDIDKEQNQLEGVNAGSSAFESSEEIVTGLDSKKGSRPATEEEEALHERMMQGSKEADENFDKALRQETEEEKAKREENAKKVADEEEQERMKAEKIKPLLDHIYATRFAIDKSMKRAEFVFGEKSDVWKSLFVAKAWLGKLLGQLGTTNPYTTKEPIKHASQIPPTAEVYNNPEEMQKFSLESNLEKVLIMRMDIAEVNEMIEATDLTASEVKNGRLAAIALTNAYVNASEANFELGYQLSVIRKG